MCVLTCVLCQYVEVLVLAVLTVSLQQQQQDEVQIVCSYGNHCGCVQASNTSSVLFCSFCVLLTRVRLCICVFNCMQICDLVQ